MLSKLHRISLVLIVSGIAAGGCAQPPQIVDPLRELGVRDRDAKEGLAIKFDRYSSYRILSHPDSCRLNGKEDEARSLLNLPKPAPSPSPR